MTTVHGTVERKYFMLKELATWLLLSVACASFAQTTQTAQAPGKVYRIGYLHGSTPGAMELRNEAFRQGLRELGYVEGKNLTIEWRYADGSPERLPALAAELVRLKVDVIVTAGSSSTHAAKQATSSIPIVMTNETDPVGSGAVASLARPGANVTGLSNLSADLAAKWLELLKTVVPGVSRVAVLGTSSNPGYAQTRAQVDLAAGVLKVKLRHLDILDANALDAALQGLPKQQVGAIVVLPSPVLVSHRAQIVEFALKQRLPAMYPRSDYVDEGGLMTYSTSVADLDRRAATYIDKIFRGSAPAELPVEQPMKFEFVINQKTATQIGLKIPSSVLLRADRVIR